MVKKPLSLDGMLNIQIHPTDTGIPQRGSLALHIPRKSPKKRDGEKRLTLALNKETYRRLRLYAAETDQTHQTILENALIEYLNRVIT